jgi:hypothetical protein
VGATYPVALTGLAAGRDLFRSGKRTDSICARRGGGEFGAAAPGSFENEADARTGCLRFCVGAKYFVSLILATAESVGLRESRSRILIRGTLLVWLFFGSFAAPWVRLPTYEDAFLIRWISFAKASLDRRLRRYRTSSDSYCSSMR